MNLFLIYNEAKLTKPFLKIEKDIVDLNNKNIIFL